MTTTEFPAEQPALPLPEAGDDLAPAPAEPQTPEAPEQISRRKKLVALVLLLMFLILLLLGAWYLLFRKPIGEIIPPAVLKVMPAYQYSLSGMTRPEDVAASPDGTRIYVTQTEGTEDTLILDRNGTNLGALHLPQGTNGHPFFVAVNPKTGEVYASDRRDGAVFIFKADGTYVKEFDHGSTDVWQPLGISFDAQGNLFVGDVASATPVVHEFGPDGKLIRDIGATSGLASPSGIAEDANGNVYVTDTTNGRLLVFSPTGDLLGKVSRGVAEGNLGMPVGVALDDKNQILVVDSAGSTVQIYAPIQSGAASPVFVDKFGQHGTGDGQFLYPNGMRLDGQGRIYVADYANNRLQVWSY
jgi:DNA-binding beta-propeller fold protein YncE